MTRVPVTRESFVMKPGAPAPWRRKWAFGLAVVMAASAPAFAAAAPGPARPFGPPSPTAPAPEKGQEKGKKDDLPPIPDGVPTTRETAFLPTVGEMKAGREAEKEVPKEYKIIAEGEKYERLQRV